MRSAALGAHSLVHGFAAGVALRDTHQPPNLGREGAEHHLDFLALGAQSLQGADGRGTVTLERTIAQIE